MADTVTVLDFPAVSTLEDADVLYLLRGTGVDRDKSILGATLKGYLGETLITIDSTGAVNLANYKTNLVILCNPASADIALTITGKLSAGNKLLIVNNSASYKVTASIISTSLELVEGEWIEYYADASAMNLLGGVSSDITLSRNRNKIVPDERAVKTYVDLNLSKLIKEIYDMELSNSIADPNNDITINSGHCFDSTGTYFMENLVPITKQLDAAWSAGTGNGGLFSGSKAINTTYHVFIIRNDATGLTDAGFDTDVDAANRPAGYTAYRRRGGFMTNGSGNIIPFIHDWQTKTFRLSPRILTKSEWQVATAGELVALNVPVGIKVIPQFIFTGGIAKDTGSSNVLNYQILSPDETAYAQLQKDSGEGLFIGDMGIYHDLSQRNQRGVQTHSHSLQYKTNSSAQLYFKRIGTYWASTTYSTLQTLGWQDYTL